MSPLLGSNSTRQPDHAHARTHARTKRNDSSVGQTPQRSIPIRRCTKCGAYCTCERIIMKPVKCGDESCTQLRPTEINYTSMTLTECFEYWLASAAWGLSFGIICLGIFAWDLSFGNFRLRSFTLTCSLGNFRFASFVWERSLGTFRLMFSAWDVSLGSFRFGSFVWELLLGVFRFGTSFRIVRSETSIGDFCLGPFA